MNGRREVTAREAQDKPQSDTRRTSPWRSRVLAAGIVMLLAVAAAALASWVSPVLSAVLLSMAWAVIVVMTVSTVRASSAAEVDRLKKGLETVRVQANEVIAEYRAEVIAAVYGDIVF